MDKKQIAGLVFIVGVQTPAFIFFLVWLFAWNPS